MECVFVTKDGTAGGSYVEGRCVLSNSRISIICDKESCPIWQIMVSLKNQEDRK